MTKEDASWYSWIALMGLAITAASAFVGIVVASYYVSKNDEALVGGLIWGTIVGVAFGSLAVGGSLARRHVGPFTPWVLSPGACLGAPLLVSGIITGEAVSMLAPLGLMLGISGLAAEVGRRSTTKPPRESRA